MKDTGLIKEAIKHINEVLESDCNEACKQDHIKLKRWLEEFLECRSRVCKNCEYFSKLSDDYPGEIGFCEKFNNSMVWENFGCNRFERRQNENK